MTRVLVCGGRTYGVQVENTDADLERAMAQVQRLREVLGTYHEQAGIDLLIHGAAKGADTYAGIWARNESIPVDAYPADWEAHGSFAGPVRNALMLHEGNPDLVIAFPGGSGTRDMIRKARKAGVEVIEIA